MAMVVIDTVDAPAADAIREALEDAGIEVRVVPIQPFRQLEYLRHQHRPRADIEVPKERVEEARAILGRLEAEVEQAVMAEAAASGARGEDEDGSAAAEAAALDPRRSVAVTFLISLIVPVAGPIYAGSMRYTLISLALHGAAFLVLVLLPGCGGTDPLCTSGVYKMILAAPFFVAGRLFDITAAPLLVKRRNAGSMEESDAARS